MNRRRLAFTVLFSLLLFAVLPLSVWLDARFGAWYVFGVPFFILLLGYGLLWRYRLLFLLLLIALAGTGLLYRYGDIVLGMLLFYIPYAAACVALGYRIAEKLSPVEWVEPEYSDVEPGSYEGYGEHVESRPRWNPYADSRPVIVRRKPMVEEVESKGARKDEDPCGGEIIDLLLEKSPDDPEVERRLREYMECRARWFIEHFHEWEKRHGIRVPKGADSEAGSRSR